MSIISNLIAWMNCDINAMRWRMWFSAINNFGSSCRATEWLQKTWNLVLLSYGLLSGKHWLLCSVKERTLQGESIFIFKG